MTNVTPGEVLPTFPKKVKDAFFQGQRYASEGAYWSIPVLAMEAATAQRGEMLPTLAVQTVSTFAQMPVSGAVSAGLTLALGMSPGVAALAATVVVGMAANQFEHTLIRKYSKLSTAAQNMNKARFGSGYMDTQSAFQRRQQSVANMSRATPSSRRWLGQEAVFLHK